MLTSLDDSQWHQLPTTFDHVGTSDPRFFDRVWFAASDPAGTSTVHLTLGVYANMNVVDAGCVVVHDGIQHNVRSSRQLRPRHETFAGPIRVDVLEPMRRLRLTVSPGEHGISGELIWSAVAPAHEEPPHFRRRRGRVVEDYTRFDQIGTCTGWLEADGQRIEVDKWWSCRDHSWGVRERVGIAEPVTGPPAPRAGGLFAFLFFSTDSHAGHVQAAPGYTSAGLTDRKTQDTVDHIPVVGLQAAFSDDQRPRRMTEVTFALGTDGGETRLRLVADRPAVAMTGLGYGGYADGLGLGVWRGTEHLEHDRWDVSHPATVVMPDGKATRPVHRIQPVRVTARHPDGATSTGNGSLTFVAEGPLTDFGLPETAQH
ncbi:hypothetical protein [Streptodolium elevatio]|uniref:Uncharacterized protein n=1 Tax=Streptodolium elevatio TaxID=3157996 RepID=A0ABV3DSW3_9ACTN